MTASAPIMARVGSAWFYESLDRALRPILPAIAMLWLPVGIGLWARLPGSGDLTHARPLLQAMLVAGLIPLLLAMGEARLRTGSARRGWTSLAQTGWLAEIPIRYCTLTVTAACFFASFAAWKSAIPMVHPFAWDRAIWEAGALVHRGQADILLAPWFGSALALKLLDELYQSWTYVLFATLVWQTCQSDVQRTRRFWLAFALVWIVLGIFTATLFSSAGPCFAKLITGSTRYDELVARLIAADKVYPLAALQGQEFLWRAYAERVVPMGGGISAFPSLHVAGATLIACVCWDRNKWLGAVSTLYVAAIMIGAVMLGWHYSLDAEFGAAGVIVMWWLAGVLTMAEPVRGRKMSDIGRLTETVAPDAARSAGSEPARGDRTYTLWRC